MGHVIEVFSIRAPLFGDKISMRLANIAGEKITLKNGIQKNVQERIKIHEKYANIRNLYLRVYYPKNSSKNT